MTSVVEFEKFLQGHDTATAALVAWCRRYDGRGADDLAVTLLSDRVAQPGEYQGPLRPCAGETIQCRRVLLRWGQRVVSEAENWYVPQRLPVAIRRMLAEGALPFGAVVAELMPRRTTTTMLRCEQIAGGGREAAELLEQLARAQVFSPPEAFVLHVHAMMTVSGVMLADVREHYRRELLMS
ncbi:hypothetical protein [Rhodopseudomonas pseudopalustris]|uniref:Uncharacterized protein n=2 Tax=Rhodopseudomonas TaxID=1073 RepID=Q139A9_RHOPS|nr:hypothetical protein [Rhodopseudomonas pseudopalustris]ABE39330.1 conserved hypothetical protein [Rhodopseudomonas palustris BisB5]MBB1090735.1 hypothetical protein [Rhodopseudomonas palustris]SEO75561.1 hypothetical protein SAMN05444123_104371 [Rhodopseudomonas pseudopalustris]